MISLIVMVVATFVVPIGLAISIPFLAIGAWFMILGFTTREAKKAAVASSSGMYIFWGGIVVSLSLTYLLHASGFDARVSLIALITGVLLSVVITNLLEHRTNRASI